MGPKALLDNVKNATDSRDYELACDMLHNYWGWRRKGGFEPEGGDFYARFCQRAIDANF